MDRRQFIGVSVGGTLAGLTGSTRAAGASAVVDLRALAHPELLSIVGPEAVREIGRGYRALVPSENLAAPPWPRSIAKQVEQDFANGRTMVLRGWVVSVTEARQSALFSLLSA